MDAGYPNRTGFLAPYKDSKYHLPEFHQGPGPQGKKELFNHARLSLRNVIERAFGVQKMKWRILLDLSSFRMHKQSQIIFACMALHNFIRDHDKRDDDFVICDEDDNYVPLEQPSSSQGAARSGGNDRRGEEDQSMNRFHD